MTPPIASGGSPVPVSPIPEDPKAAGAGGAEGSKPKPFEGSHLLNGILKKSGRVPTHPLTAKTPQGETPAKEVTPADAKKANSFRLKGDEHFKKENFKKALAYYEMARKANPGDAQILLSLAKAEHATGNLLHAHDHYNELLASDPSQLVVRALRSDANQAILMQMQRMAPKIKPEQQAEFIKMGQMLTLEMAADRATLLAHNADKELEGLKGMEQTLATLHGKPKADKERACQALLAMAMDTLDLAQLPAQDPKDAELIPEKLGLMTKEIFGVLARFAKADPDPALQRLAPLFEGYQALLEGNTEAAMKSFEVVREEGLKVLGEGDAEKGEKILQERMEKAAKALAANDPAGAEKIYQEEIPPGLADAYIYLKQFEAQKTRMVSLVATAAWEEDVNARHAEGAKKANGFWSMFGEFVDVVGGDPTEQDKLAIAARKELNLVHAVRDRLALGKANTLEEALKDVEATETGELKDQATAQLDQIAKGEDPGILPLSKVVELTKKPKMSSDAAGTLMSFADSMGTFGGRPKMRTLLYAAVQSFSKDKEHQDRAASALKELAKE